ncbi:MAG: OPT/YSL family transporter [Candidatus Diapherotrites archaeon]
MKQSEVSLKAVLVGFLLSIVVAMYSAYLGLMVGGVYWPIVTTSLMAMALLKLLGKTSKQEIIVAQTAASTGGLLAAGIIFTIPALYLLGIKISSMEIVLIALSGGLLGVLFTVPLRKEMIEREKLPFADGVAAATLVEAGDEGGEKAKKLGMAFGIGALLAIIRDYFKAIPSLVSFDTLKLGFSKYFSLGFGVSLVAFAGGFLIGPLFTGVWFLGAITSNFFIVPWLVSSNAFSDKASAIASITGPLGIGVIIGAAVAYFILKGLPALKKMLEGFKVEKRQLNRFWFFGVLVVVLLVAIAVNLDPLLSIVAIVGAFFMAYIGARATGEMNVDPMEVFAIIVLLIAKLFLGFQAMSLVVLAAIVCIAAGMGGDFMQDLKAGHILKASPESQTITQVLGVFAGALVLGFVLTALQSQIGSPMFPAPQAFALKGIISAQSIELPMLAGILIGFIATILLTLLFRAGIVMVAFGIGLYAPITLSFPLFVGGMIRLYADKKKLTEKGRLIAAGIIAGEGLIGVIIALLAFSGLISL